MDKSPRVEQLCEALRLRRDDDELECRALEEEREEEGGECSKLCPKSSVEGSTLTMVDCGE